MSEAGGSFHSRGFRPTAGQLKTPERPTQRGAMPTWLLFFYMWLDLIRPSFVWHFPKLLSIALFITWLVQPDKRLPKQNILMLLFLGVMLVDIVVAKNSFAAVWTSYGMAVLLFGLCLPLVQFIDSLARFRTLIHWLMAIFVMIGAWASVHEGFGPAAADGGQDENYVSACMAMALPLLLYSSISAETKLKRILYLIPIPIVLLAVAVAANPSRGGFLGFIGTISYMVYHSKKRMMALAGVGVLVVIVGLMASATFWNEISTTTDIDTGTADHRKDLWRIATYMFMSYPLTGVGPNNYRWRIEEFETGEIVKKYGHSLGGSAFTHSLYFELLAELGSAGVIIFALIVMQNFRDLKEVKRRVQQAMAEGVPIANNDEAIPPSLPAGTLKLLYGYSQGIAASLIAFLICSAFISTLYYSYFWLYTALIQSFKLIIDKMLVQPVEGGINQIGKGRVQ